MEQTLTLVEKTAFLKSVPVLSKVPTEALAQLASRARELHIAAGEAIFKEGEPNRGTFLVLDGTVELRRGRALVRVMEAGAAFGELFARDGEPHVYSASAIVHAHVLNITLDDMFEDMHDFPEFGVGMVKTLAFRNHELVERLLELEQMLAKFHEALQRAGAEIPSLSDSIQGQVAPTDFHEREL